MRTEKMKNLRSEPTPQFIQPFVEPVYSFDRWSIFGAQNSICLPKVSGKKCSWTGLWLGFFTPSLTAFLSWNAWIHKFVRILRLSNIIALSWQQYHVYRHKLDFHIWGKSSVCVVSFRKLTEWGWKLTKLTKWGKVGGDNAAGNVHFHHHPCHCYHKIWQRQSP